MGRSYKKLEAKTGIKISKQLSEADYIYGWKDGIEYQIKVRVFKSNYEIWDYDVMRI